MSGSTKTVPSTKGTSTLVRPRFAPGMLLQHDDLEQLNLYTRDLSRLLFRSFFGCGVVCGLVVKPDPKCGQDTIIVGAGLGLDCAGDPIYVPKPTRVTLDENCQPNPNDVLWVVLCATTGCCAPRPSTCPSDDDDESGSPCTRERDGFEIRAVAQRPKCACSCVPDKTEESTTGADAKLTARVYAAAEDDCCCVKPADPCYQKHYAGECACGCDDCARGAACDCVLLAKLTKHQDGDNLSWDVDHSVRRFIRPVLMRDPQPALDKAKPAAESEAAAAKAGSTVSVGASGYKPARPRRTGRATPGVA